MKNNKNRTRDHGASNAEKRKQKPKENEDAGMVNGKHKGTHDGGHEKSGRND